MDPSLRYCIERFSELKQCELFIFYRTSEIKTRNLNDEFRIVKMPSHK